MIDSAYEIAKNYKYHRYQRVLASMIQKFFDKKTGSGVSVNEQPSEEIYELVSNKSICEI